MTQMATSASLTLKSLASSASAASHSWIASRILARASLRVLPCEWQPRNAGQLTDTPSRCSISEPCILVHLEKALAAGATKAELLEACGVAIAMGGGPTMAYIPLVLKYLEGHV